MPKKVRAKDILKKGAKLTAFNIENKFSKDNIKEIIESTRKRQDAILKLKNVSDQQLNKRMTI